MCPYPFFEVTTPGAAPGPPVKPGPVFVASGGVTTLVELCKLPAHNDDVLMTMRC